MPHILTVDDSASIRETVKLTLETHGYQIFEARDGQEALEICERHPISLVITNLHMPRLDGIALTRHLRTQPAYSRIPILMLTSESDPALKLQSREAGATGWILKPFDPAKFTAVVEKVCPI